MKEKLTFTLFAGINGAGKSTLYDDINDDDELGIRINPDEIARKLGDFNNPSIQIRAGKIAVQTIANCIKNRVSFNQETTLAGKSTINLIKKLKANGYNVNMYYVGLSSKELAAERVAFRVKNGGHNIPLDLIYSRYNKSLENCKNVIKYCNNITIYDNSNQNKKLILKVKCGKEYIAPVIPNWAKEIIDSYKEAKKSLSMENWKNEMESLKNFRNNNCNDRVNYRSIYDRER